MSEFEFAAMEFQSWFILETVNPSQRPLYQPLTWR
jgi:hypothetical protein